METSENSIVSSTENVAHILSSDWIVDGEIQHTAFMLKPDETYISVNRPAIDTFDNDVASFISSHSNYCVSGTNDTYRAAVLNVGDIRAIDVEYEGKVIISADMVLLDVRYQLLSLSTLEQRKLVVDSKANR